MERLGVRLIRAHDQVVEAALRDDPHALQECAVFRRFGLNPIDPNLIGLQVLKGYRHVGSARRY